MNLVLDNISYQYAHKTFSYSVKLTEGITGVFGLSGSGKTTLMNLISGILKPGSGRMMCNDHVFFDGQLKINVPANKRNIGVVFQENLLFPHFTVLENLLYSKPYHKNKKQVISLETVLELMDIQSLLSRKPNELSGGERQRVAIGRTLMSQPELLLLDEPFSNLDRNRRKQIISYLLKINHRFNIPLLIISHDLEDILKLTRSLLIIKDGKIQTSGNYLDIVESGKAPGLLSHRRYLNVLDLCHHHFSASEDLHYFSHPQGDETVLLKANSDGFLSLDMNDRLVRFCIFPGDIAINLSPIGSSSIQNQLSGTIKDVFFEGSSAFVLVECGMDFIAELTLAAVRHLDLKKGKRVYCLIKAKSIEVVHVFKKQSHTSTEAK